MTEVVSDLSLDGVRRAVTDVGLQARVSAVEGTGTPCVVGSNNDREFIVYIQEKQSLCFQAVIRNPVPGFTDICNYWNSARRFAKVFPFLDGYAMRFEAEISHGVTRENLRALIRTFSRSVVEFSEFAKAPKSPLP